MLISYPSFLSDVTDLRKNSIVGSIGYHLIPGHSPLLGGWGLGINSHSDKNKKLLNFSNGLAMSKLQTIPLY